MTCRRPSISTHRHFLAFSVILPILVGSCSIPSVDGCGTLPAEIGAVTNQVVTPILAAALNHSRQTAYQTGTNAIPPVVRTSLRKYYSQKELDRVRWTVADESAGVANFVVSKGTRYKAITLGNVIIFQDEIAAKSVELWAHELVHSRQFHAAGNIRNFARNYLAQWPSLEHQAVRRTNKILSDLNASRRQRPASFDRCPSSSIH